MSDWSAQFVNEPIQIAQASAHDQMDHTTTAAPRESAHTSEPEVSPRTFFGLSLIALLFIAVMAIVGTRRLRMVPRGLQNVLEFLVESLYGIPEMVMGPRGRKYAPFVSTFFLYILVMNFMGLIPTLRSGTASLSVTLGLAIVAFFAVQYYGFQAHGAKYLAHFIGPVPAMAFLILPLEIVAELVRPVSLSVRLYGNLFGEEKVIEALATQISPYAAVLLLPLQVLTIFLQAFVFTLLVTVYIALATEKHEAEPSASSEASAH